MSEGLIESIDNLTLAVQALQSQQIDYSTRLEAIEAAIANKECCIAPIAPEAIYDCSTGTLQWIDFSTGNITPTFPGLHFPTITPTVCINIDNYWLDSGIKLPPTPQTPTWDDTDTPWGEYDVDDAELYDDTLADMQNDEKCKKINLFLYLSIEKLETISDLFAAGTATSATVVGVLSAGLAPLAFVSVGGIIVEFAISVPLIYGIADVLMTAIPHWGDFTYTITEADKQDALCRLYNATTATAVKQEWDQWIEDNFNWFAPQGFLLRSFMTPSMANAIVNTNIVVRADEPRYLLSCDGCEGGCVKGTWTGTDVAWFYGSSNYQRATLIVWDSVTCAAINWNNDYRIGYKFTKYYDSEVVYTNWEEAYAFVKRCTADGGATLAGCSVRLITNTTGYPVLVYQGGNLENPITIPDDGTSVDIPDTGNCNNWYVIGVVRPVGVLWSGSFTVEIQ